MGLSSFYQLFVYAASRFGRLGSPPKAGMHADSSAGSCRGMYGCHVIVLQLIYFLIFICSTVVACVEHIV